MSKRRSVGDLVYKRPGAGFTGVGAWCVIQDDGFDEWCPSECGDEDCREWATLHVMGETRAEAEALIAVGGKGIGMCCHVNECELFDDDTEEQRR